MSPCVKKGGRCWVMELSENIGFLRRRPRQKGPAGGVDPRRAFYV